MTSTRQPYHHLAVQRLRRGVTFVDLVITILIISIVTAVATPKLAQSLTHYRIETAAHRIAADINHARRYARSKSADRSVEFSVSPPNYQLVDVPDINHNGSTTSVDLTVEHPDISLTSVDFDGDTALTFDHYGRPKVDSVAMTSGEIVIQSGPEQRTVVIDPGTGKASVQ